VNCCDSTTNFNKLNRESITGAFVEGIQNDAYGTDRKAGCSFDDVAALQRARMRTTFRRDSARSVKSTGRAELGTVKVAVTGLNVPDVNAGITTFELDEFSSCRTCNPGFVFAGSTVTVP